MTISETEREPAEIASISEDPDQPHAVAALGQGRQAPEAIELTRIGRQYSRASSRHASSAAAVSPHVASLSGWGRTKHSLRKFWKSQISIIVDHEASRDHLALERTFLGYLRTSVALSMLGVSVAQLFRLHNARGPGPGFGFYVLSKPLACICQGAAIYSLLLGAYRSWRCQNAIARGSAITGGFELVLLGFGIFSICLLFFILVITVKVSQ